MSVSKRDTASPLSDISARADLLKRIGAVIEVEVRGWSMAPTLVDGDLVRIRCGAGPAQGLVASWMAGERLISHRVAWVDRRGTFVTWGDGTWLPDPPQPFDLSLGVVEQVRRHGTWQPLGPAPSRRALRDRSGRALVVAFRISGAVGPWIPKLAHAVLYLGVRRLIGPSSRRGSKQAPAP